MKVVSQAIHARAGNLCRPQGGRGAGLARRCVALSNPPRAAATGRPISSDFPGSRYVGFISSDDLYQPRTRQGVQVLTPGVTGWPQSWQQKTNVYEVGSQPSEKGARIGEEIVAAEEKKGFRVGGLNRFLLRTRYFTDSGILGTQEFVSRHYRLFEEHFTCRREKRPRAVAGLDGLYSLKRLAEGAPQEKAMPSLGAAELLAPLRGLYLLLRNS